MSQGAGMLLIAAGILLASTVFALPDQPPGTRDGNAADDPVGSSRTVVQRAWLTTVSETGRESRLVVESASGKQLRLQVVTEKPTSSEARNDTHDQQHEDSGQKRLADVCRWLVASIGFAGALFVLVDENPVLAILLLGPQIYGLTIAYILVGGWTIVRELPSWLGSGSAPLNHSSDLSAA